MKDATWQTTSLVLPTQNTSINSVTFIQVYNNSEVNFIPIITKSE